MWLYKGRWLLRGSDTTALQGRSNGVIGCRRAANLYIFRLQGGRAQGGQATREAAAALEVPCHDDVLCCYKYMPGHDGIRLPALLLLGMARTDALYIDHAGESKIKGGSQQAPGAEQDEQGRASRAQPRPQ